MRCKIQRNTQLAVSIDTGYRDEASNTQLSMHTLKIAKKYANLGSPTAQCVLAGMYSKQNNNIRSVYWYHKCFSQSLIAMPAAYWEKYGDVIYSLKYFKVALKIYKKAAKKGSLRSF